MTTEEPKPAQKPKRGRSPSYPGIDLREALERAKVLLDKEGRNPAPLSAILGHWGYKANSGPGLTALAALKKFGLLIDEGTGPARKARVSDDALRILLDEREDSADRLKAIQEAALKPPIHAELWGRYRESLPSDATLRFELQTERAFTKAGVDEFIPRFKSTLAFARLENGGKLPAQEEDKREDQSGGLMTPATTLQDASPKAKPEIGTRETRVVQLPISPSEWAALQAAFPLTEAMWNQMLAVLNAMKPALVHDENVEDSLEQR